MADRLRRREYLAVAWAVSLSAVAGCSGDGGDSSESGDGTFGGDQTDTPDGDSTESSDNDPTETPTEDTTMWSTFRGEPTRLGVRSADVGPGNSLSVGWEVDAETLLAAVEDVDPSTLELPAITGHVSWPVVNEDTVFWTMGYQWEDPNSEEMNSSLRLVATDVTNGTIQWTHQFDTEFQNWFAPELDGGRLYVPAPGENLQMRSFAPDTGEPRGQIDLGAGLGGTGQPLVADGRIYVIESGPEQSTLSAFDVESGIDWSVEAGVVQPGRPAITLANGQLWYYDREARAVVAHATSDGSERLREPVEIAGRRYDTPVLLSSPMVTGSGVYAAGDLVTLSRRGYAPLVSLDPDDGTQNWRYEPPAQETEDTLSSTHGYPLNIDGSVITTGFGELEQEANTSGAGLVAVDEADGNYQWGVTIDSPTFAPVAAGDIIYVMTSNGVEAISTSGTHLDSVAIDGTTVGQSPALGGGRLFVPTRNGLVAIE